MVDNLNLAPIYSSSEDENVDYSKKVKFELDKMECKAIMLGGITNMISGLAVVFVFYDVTHVHQIIAWYAALILINVINMLWAYKFEHTSSTPEQLETWRKKARYILAILSLTWGSIGILFYSANLHYQLYTMAFLLAVLVGFSFGTITNFAGAAVSILCILLPSIIFRFYVGSEAFILNGSDPELNISLGAGLFILGSFLLVASYIGNRWLRKFFLLTYENIALNKKLENMNKFLEERVKDRTIELENSLKLVTYQATHDLLTELPNQRLLQEYMQQAIIGADHEKKAFGVIFFMINEIEKINDGLGHQAGDLVIRTIAQRFKKMFPANQPAVINFTVALSRKDVFVILIDPIFNISEIEASVEKLFSVVDDPVYTEQQVIKLTASIGVSMYPRNGRDIKSLLMNADAAMLRAKQQGGNNFNMYRTEINADISKQLEMEVNLHSAVKNSEFTLHYQPFYDLKTHKICGMEALVRWKSPSLGLISPADFIPLAEANGIIIPLGEWVYRTACNQTKIWHQLGFSNLKIAVNLSAKQLQQKNILQTIMHILEESHLKPENIEFELTESEAFMENVIPILRQIKEHGFGLSIDDFGTGYSGLTNLKIFTIDKLKIDQSFVKDVTTNEESKVIVSNTIALAKQMNIKVLAEGVETKEQLTFLQEHGCDMIQGYYISPAVTAEVFSELLKNQSKLTI